MENPKHGVLDALLNPSGDRGLAMLLYLRAAGCQPTINWKSGIASKPPVELPSPATATAVASVAIAAAVLGTTRMLRQLDCCIWRCINAEGSLGGTSVCQTIMGEAGTTDAW